MKGLRGLWGRMIPVVAFLVLFVGVATANAYTISGTVTNNSGKSGSRVYLSVGYQFGGDTGLGVSIPAPSPGSSASYSIRGVPDGMYVVNAFLDRRTSTSATRHANDPSGSSQPVTIVQTDVNNADITLTLPSFVTLQPPTIEIVFPGPGSALISWETPRSNSGNGFEIAYSYNVYWHTDNTVSPTNYTGKKTGIPARDDGMYIQTMLNDTTPLAASGTTLWYVVTGQIGPYGQTGSIEGPASDKFGPVQIGAIPTDHPSTFTVSGTVTIDSGITPITGPLLVAVHSDNNGVYLANINNPGLSNNFTVTGVPNGSYEVFSLIDQNNDGLIWAGDYTVGERNAPMITVNGADMTAPVSAIPKKDVEASVSTAHFLEASGEESYGLNFNVRQAFQLPVNVAVLSGQDVAGPVDLAVRDGGFSYWANSNLRPEVGTQYTLDLGYAGGTSASVQVAVTAVLDSFPESLAPEGNVTFNPAPTFSWAPPLSPPAGVFTYSLNLNGNNLWWDTDRLPSTQTSALFNFNERASQNALADNSVYTWGVTVQDKDGNAASKSTTFFSGGSISGTVKGADTDTGVAGISVQLYDWSGNFMPWQYNARTATDGSFVIGGLPTGTYRVCFYPGNTGYISQCYDNKESNSYNATNIPVNSPSDTSLNPVTLAKAAKITGTVTASGGGAIQGVSVELRDSNGGWVNGPNQAQTDGNGAYTLSGIQTGVSFKLYFNGAAKGYIGEWYTDASDQQGAQPITLNAGQNFTADATLVQGASITGTVTNSVSHVGIQGINVQLYDQNGSWIWTNSNITTGTDGTYTIGGLATGTYKVCFNSGSTNYIGKCYDIMANEPSNATAIEVTAPEARAGIDASLVLGGTITGQVTNGSGGIQWVNVQLRDTDGNWVSGVPGASTQQDGNYTFGGVPAGDYKVYFDGANTGYVGKWYSVSGAVEDQTNATALRIDAGQTQTNINAVLPLGGSISGQVTDIDTSAPVSGVNVQIFDNSGQSIPNFGGASTNGSGNYSFGGLPGGNYKVCFYSGSTSYLGTCYDISTLDPSSATSIPVTVGQDSPGKSIALKLGATITGMVTNGSTPVPNINVQLQNPDGSWVQSGSTDGTGNYTILAIPAGNYRVFFDTFNTDYVKQWYNDKSSLNSAEPITLANREIRNSVNAVLALAGTITGKVVDDSSLPIPGSPVQLKDTNNNPINSIYTNQNGNFTFGGLAAGNYKVEFQGSGSYFGEWYNDKASFEQADPIPVTAGNTTTLSDSILSTRQPTTTTLARSGGAIPSVYGQNATFDATVSPNTVNGFIRFRVGGVDKATIAVVNGSASWTTAAIPAGDQTVEAVYDGDATHFPSTSNQLIQTVTTATLTVTADALTKGYGVIDPPLTYTYNGIVNGDPPSIFTGSLTREAGASVGDYAIQQGSLSAGNNYQISFTGANLTITTTALTVTANNASRAYGVANPSFTVSYTGFITGETAANLGGTLSVTTPAVQSSAPGTYAITPAGLTSANYSITFVNGTLTVNKTTLTVTADNLTKAYSSVNPPLTYTITGFTNGENLATSGVSGVPALSTTAVTGSNVGSYPITVALGGLTAVNYDFTLVNGTLSVTKATATLTLSNLIQTVGSTQPVTVTTSPGGLSVVTVTYTGISGTTYGPSTTAPSAIGNYSVVASLSNANYQATDATGTLTINAKPTPVINWSNPSNITYGTPLSGIQLNATATDPDTSATVPGTFVYTPADGAVLNAGSQTLSVTFTPTDQATYNTVSKSVSINLQKAALTITANAQTKVYGTVDPALTYVPSGLTNGDTAAVITGALARATGETVGSYTINQGTLSAGGNYTITYTGANLTITKATATVTLGTLNFTYDGAAKATTATTTPAGLTVAITYAGSATAPTSAGSYAVVATVNDTNYQGTASGTLNIAKANQTITFGALATKNTGDPAFNLTATASSGLQVSYTSSNTAVATVSGSTVTIVGFGTTNITASQAGDGNWNAATNVVQTLTVKTGQTITFGALTAVTYGDAPFTLGGTASSGLTVGYTSSDPTVASISGNTVTILKAGSVTITANQAGDATYNPAAAVSQTLTVNKAALTITANAQTKVYGTADPALTYVPSGLTNGDTAAVITGALARATGETVASYAINQGTLSAGGNYTITYTGANLTITKATATVTLGTLNFTYDGAAKATTATTIPAGLTVAITYAGSATAPTSAGSYAVVATVNDTNYQGTASGTLNIAKANQTTTFGALATKNTGDPAFNLTATASSGLPVSYTSSNTAVATVSGNTVTIVGFGTTNITAIQAGDGNWNAATNVVQTLTVKTGQTITFGALTAVTYGDAPFTLGGTASSGLTVSYTSSDPTVASVSGNTITILKAGSVTITANQAGDAIYNPALAVQQSLTLNKAPLTVTASGQTKVYGAADPALTYSQSGLTNGDTAAVITGALARVAGETVGSYAINQGTLSAGGNYTITYTGASLAITKATATVTLGTLNFIYDGTAKATTATTAPAGLTTAITYAGSATAPTSAGSYAVVATVNDTNYQGTASGTLNIAKANQTTTFGALATKNTGDPAFNLTATASSGLQVSYTSSNTAVATVSGNTVTIVGFGTTNITAIQAGDGNWNAATNVVQTLTVKTGQTITFGALTAVTYGDAPFTLGGTASSGLTVGYTSSDPTVASISGNTVTILKAGSVTITANQAGDATYNPAAAVNQTLTVNKASLTITANAQTKVYGTADPALTYVPSGLTNGDTAAVITGALARATGETVASYAINQGTLSAGGNYTITYTGANLTITKATATVTLGTLNLTYDGAAKATTATTIPAGLTVAITYAGSATAPTSAGSYAVVATVNDTNYQGTASGTLNIAKANQTTTFGALATKNTGDPAFNLTATASSGLLVSYTSSNTTVATVSGNTVTIVGFGTTNITAIQAGDGNWNAATNVVQTLTVKTGQTITFSALTAVTYGDAPFTLGGTASSGLTVSYTSSDPTVASISGNTVTILKAGSVTITANQAGDATYNPAAAVTQTLTVNKATATLTLNSASLAQTYNGSPRIVTVTTSPAGLTGVTFTYDGTAAAPTNAGSYAVVATLTNPNYQANDTNGTLVVTKATPVITWANPADITFGTALGTAQLNATASTAGIFAYTPASGTVLNAGNQALSVSFTPTDTANFNATPLTKSVTINVVKATPVITWNNPADLLFGTPLSATQLNATASVPGTFVYTPAAGTVLDPGSQTLSVTFTPTDTANFATATKTVNVNVVAASGDANQDGKIGIEDALLALQIAVGLVPMDAKYLAYCDVAPYVNGKPQPDRKIDIGDAIVILRKVVQIL